MQTVSLTAAVDWRTVVDTVQRTGAPVALEMDGTVYGVLLPTEDATRVVARYADREQARYTPPSAGGIQNDHEPTYIDLLQADPTLVPHVDGQPLRFQTVMNSSYTDPQQMYQFDDPRTGQVHVFRADELKQAIGRSFARVEFVTNRIRR